MPPQHLTRVAIYSFDEFWSKNNRKWVMFDLIFSREKLEPRAFG